MNKKNDNNDNFVKVAISPSSLPANQAKRSYPMPSKIAEEVVAYQAKHSYPTRTMVIE